MAIGNQANGRGAEAAVAPERRGPVSSAMTVTSIALLLCAMIVMAMLFDIFDSSVGNIRVQRPLFIALLLNVALILIGSSRHRELANEVRSRAAAEQRAYTLASRDPLTGFLNRRSFAEDGGVLLAGAHRRGKAVAVMLIDLDHFKMVNDVHGHATGDALLRRVAEAIDDATPTLALTARFGGDEFACAFAFDADRQDSVDRVAERLVSRLAQAFDAGGHRVHVSGSVGIARSEPGSISIESLVRSADLAMYAAKKRGRDGFAWFDRTMEDALRARAALESGLRTAIPTGEIVPYFERQIDLATGRLTGFEVLARWEHATRGLIGPDEFIPVAEQSGMIGDLSISILRQALAAAREWDPSLTLAVNISPWQLKDAWLAQKIIKTLIETGFPASRLEIEITETALFDNLALAQSIVSSLKNQGIRVALDDFGTGYSSLAHLRALPFDRIKIDRSFVTSIGDSAESAAIVGAVVGLGESLRLPVTAEGIETAQIRDRLAALGCANGQGYFYGRPMALRDVRRLLAEKRMIMPAAASPAGAVVGEKGTLLGAAVPAKRRIS